MTLPKLKPLAVSFQLSRFSFQGCPKKHLLGHGVFCTRSSHDSKAPTLADVLRARVEVKGPLTVADYMRAVLTSPGTGYYMTKDVFGSQGDFTTSPEISQLFGEMVGVWCVNELKKISPQVPQKKLVELGPGRGSLMRDVLRVFSSLKETEGLSVHLVEISPELSKIQAKLLCRESSVQLIAENITGGKKRRIGSSTMSSVQSPCAKGGIQRGSSDISTVTVRRPPGIDRRDATDASEYYYMKGETHDGLPIFWYRSLIDVPRGFSCILAHEFLDALPIHKFQRTEHGWREVLIVPDDEAGREAFKYVIARGETPASKILMKADDEREYAEVCLEAALLMRHVQKRLEEDGGTMLIADYGHEGDKTDTFRAFSKHEQTNPLAWPGSADLTADVDFDYLKKNLEGDIITFGPVSQSDFLRKMGIEARLQVLLEKCNDEQRVQLLSGYDMITDPDKMGARYKFFALFPAVYQSVFEKDPVAGFSELPIDDCSNESTV